MQMICGLKALILWKFVFMSYKFASDLFVIDRDVVFTGLHSSVASGKCSKVFAKLTELTLKFLTLAGGHVK